MQDADFIFKLMRFTQEKTELFAQFSKYILQFETKSAFGFAKCGGKEKSPKINSFKLYGRAFCRA